jgi:hypothetical protein
VRWKIRAREKWKSENGKEKIGERIGFSLSLQGASPMNRQGSHEAAQEKAESNEELAGPALRKVRTYVGIVTLLWLLILSPLYFADDVAPIGYVLLLVSSALLTVPGLLALVNLSGREVSRKRGTERAAIVGAGGATAWFLLAILFAAVMYYEVADARGEHAGEIEWGRIFGVLLGCVVVACLNVLAWRSASRVQALESSGHRKGAGKLVATGGMAAYFLCVLLGAAVLFPSTIRGRITANEVSTVGSLRSIHQAAVTYKDRYKNGYPSSLEVLGPPAEGAHPNCVRADLTNLVLALGTSAGYTLEFRPGPAVQEPTPGCPAGVASFEVVARPTEYLRTGVRSFWMDHHGVIRQTTEDRAATTNDVEIGR